MIFFVVWLILGADSQLSPVSDSKSPPLIDAVPRDLVIRPGETATLKCPLKSPSEGVSFQWFLDDQPIPVSNPTNNELLLNSASSTDVSGAYRCSAQNSNGASVSEITNVTVAAFGPFETANPNYFRKSALKNGFVVLAPPRLLALAPPVFDPIQWQWSFYNQEVYPNLTHFVSRRGELVILNLQSSNQGQYSVEASHAVLNQKLRSPAYELTIEDSSGSSIVTAPEVILPPRDTVFVKPANATSSSYFARDITLECVVAASNLVDAQIAWTYNGTVLTSDDAKYVVEEYNRRLTIRNPTSPQDNGVYACEVRSGRVAATRAEATVTIYGPPHIVSSLPAVAQAQLGRTVEINCNAKGLPTPSIRWFFNGQSCCRGNATAPAPEISPAGTLLIHALESGHEGVYQCEALNAAGSTMVSTFLRTSSNEPVFVEKPTNVSAVYGQSITLPCAATGSPPPQIRWQLNGTEISFNGNANLQLNNSGSLIITNVGADSSGWYTCEASNNAGKVEARAFVFVAGKAQIINGPEDQSVVIGSNVVFPCAVSQQEGDFVRNWFFKNQLLTQGALRNIELRPDGSLMIRQVGPMNIGPYSCTITGSSGTQRQTGSLKIVEKPGMPLYVKSELMNDTLPAKVSLSWVDGFDGNSAIIKYIVENRYLGAQGLWSNWEPVLENVRHDQKVVLIDNLKPSTNYEFRVIAINRFGAGMPSMASNNVTLPQQPPAAAPQSADGSARSASSIMFQWQPPPKDQWNGDILGYVVRYRLANYPDIPWIYKNITDVRARNILLDELITWREYEIQVAAYNERGMGVFSKSRYITTLEGVPAEAPSNVVVTVLNSTSVHVSFSPPQQQMIPGVNLGYKVEVWKSAPVGRGTASKTVRVLPYSLSKIETIIGRLESYVQYNITVLCFTAPGDGPRSVPVEIRTKQDVPEAVSNLRVEEVLFSSVKLVWEPPVHPNGLLTNYTLSYWVTNETELSKKTIVLDSNITMYKVEGLTPSTKYSFDLYASTEIGRGPSQNANIESGVPPELPGPPSALAVSNIQSRSVTLQFTPGFDGKTTISRWIVEAIVGAATNWIPIFNITAPEARFFEVPSLRPYTSYKLRLIAENVVGRSPPSESTEEFQTLQAPPEYSPPEADAQPISPTVVKVTWTPVQLHAWNGIAKGYIIVWRKMEADNGSVPGLTGKTPGPAAQIIIEDPGASEHRLENLEPYTVYEIALSAFNNIAPSNANILTARTYEAAPSSPPSNVSAVGTSSTEISVTWAPLPHGGSRGKLLGYKVSYRPNSQTGPQAEQKMETVIGEDQRSIVLRELTASTQYILAVAAFTIVGIGPYSQVITVATNEDIPGVPSEVVFTMIGSNEARITWKVPYHPNGVITHYSVAFWPTEKNVTSLLITGSPLDGGRNNGVTKTTLNSDITNFAATGLTPKTFYTFAVSAKTGTGWGHEATLSLYTANTQVPPPSPGRPAQSVSHQQRPRQITIVWDVAPSATEPVRLFDISYQMVNDDKWVSWVERVPGTTKAATITGLLPNKAYRFRVRAVNDYGESRYSPDSDWIKTLEAEPTSPPDIVEVMPFEADGIRVTWRSPQFDGWNSDFIGYRILYKPYDSNETMKFQELPMTGGERNQWSYDLKGLRRFTHYIIQMQAFNQEGSSPSSAPFFIYVGFSVPKSAVSHLRAETLDSTQIRLSWENWPQKEDPVNGFKINYLIIGRPRTDMRQDIAKPEENSFVLRDLPKFTNFTIEVAPFNKAGDGPSSSVQAQTSPDRPGPVGQLIFTDVLIDSVNVSWAQPSEPNGIVTGYLVSYKTYKLQDEYIKQIQEKVTRSYLVVSNLEENATATFSVQAETAAGYGPPVSGRVTLGPQPGSPDPPARPRFVPGENSVTLEWENGAPGQSPITAYIIQSAVVDDGDEDGGGGRVERELLISPNAVSSLRWDTLAMVEIPEPIYTVPYNQLEPGAYYTFRVIARNAQGVSYPSPPTDPPLKMPASMKNKPFYLEWWFLVILALISLLIIIIIVTILYITGRDQNFKYKRRNSDQSLHLADGGIVTYELRASRRPQHQHQHNKNSASAASTLSKQITSPYVRHPVSTRPDPLKTLIFDANEPINAFGYEEDEANEAATGDDPTMMKADRNVHGVASFGRVPNLYHSLGSGVNGGGDGSGIKRDARSADAVHMMEESRVTEKTNLDLSSSGDEFNDFDDDDEPSQDRDVSSIVQHYETSDGIYRETWRRAKSSAHRPVSTSSQQSDAVSGPGTTNPFRQGPSPPPTQPPSYSHTPVPNFSSFV